MPGSYRIITGSHHNIQSDRKYSYMYRQSSRDHILKYRSNPYPATSYPCFSLLRYKYLSIHRLIKCLHYPEIVYLLSGKCMKTVRLKITENCLADINGKDQWWETDHPFVLCCIWNITDQHKSNTSCKLSR